MRYLIIVTLLVLHTTLFAEDVAVQIPVPPEEVSVTEETATPTESPVVTEETATPAKSPVATEETATPMKSPVATEETATPAKSPIPSAVRESLAGLLNQDLQKATIIPAPIKGLYEVMINSEVLYITADGQHLITGNIIDAKTRKNLTDSKRDVLRAKAIDTVDEKEMVVFAPEKETKYTVNVFTDVDCGYCAKFHQEVAELNKAGVKIRYLAFPRAGIGSDTYKKMISVWCAENQQQAITDAKARRDIPVKECDSPVRKEYELGKSIGVSGTPALVLSDGELVPGYVPATKLVEYLKQKF